MCFLIEKLRSRQKKSKIDWSKNNQLKSFFRHFFDSHENALLFLFIQWLFLTHLCFSKYFSLHPITSRLTAFIETLLIKSHVCTSLPYNIHFLFYDIYSRFSPSFFLLYAYIHTFILSQRQEHTQCTLKSIQVHYAMFTVH